MYIPIATPHLTDLERKYLNDAFDSGRISSTGKYVDLFEEKWAETCNSNYSLSVANGTVALHLILVALGIGPGDEVIVPSFTYIASVNAIKYVGATPVFVDIDSDTWCLSAQDVAEKLSIRTKAILAVHIYGNPCDVFALNELCLNNKLYLIEDAAEAPFAEVYGQRIGTFGIAAAFSFYGNKILTSGEGGAITTDNFELYQRMKLLRGQGMDPFRRYHFIEIGYNYRLTNLQCALLCAQVERADEMLSRRTQIYELYDSFFRERSNFRFQQVNHGNKIAPWLYTVLLAGYNNIQRDSVIEELGKENIESRPTFIPVHTLPPYNEYAKLSLEATNQIAPSGISLPTSSILTKVQVEKVATQLLTILDR
jgi:perosamine synthetase